MSTNFSRPAGTVEQLLNMLTAELKPPHTDYTLLVQTWMPTILIMTEHLQKGTASFVVTVRFYAPSVPSRVYNRVPLDNILSFEVAIYSSDHPPYIDTVKSRLRDELVEQILQAFKKYNFLGTVQNVNVNDHMLGQMWLINSNLKVEQQKQY